MILNIYFPGKEAEMIEELRRISERRRRSVSFLIREALERYLQTAKPESRPSQRKGAEDIGVEEE